MRKKLFEIILYLSVIFANMTDKYDEKNNILHLCRDTVQKIQNDTVQKKEHRNAHFAFLLSKELIRVKGSDAFMKRVLIILERQKGIYINTQIKNNSYNWEMAPDEDFQEIFFGQEEEFISKLKTIFNNSRSAELDNQVAKELAEQEQLEKAVAFILAHLEKASGENKRSTELVFTGNILNTRFSVVDKKLQVPFSFPFRIKEILRSKYNLTVVQPSDSLMIIYW